MGEEDRTGDPSRSTGVSASSVQFIIELNEGQSRGLTMKGSSGVPVCVCARCV